MLVMLLRRTLEVHGARHAFYGRKFDSFPNLWFYSFLATESFNLVLSCGCFCYIPVWVESESSYNPWILFSCHRGGTFMFSFQVSPIYPHEAPKVKCKTKVKDIITLNQLLLLWVDLTFNIHPTCRSTILISTWKETSASTS